MKKCPFRYKRKSYTFKYHPPVYEPGRGYQEVIDINKKKIMCYVTKNLCVGENKCPLMRGNKE